MQVVCDKFASFSGLEFVRLGVESALVPSLQHVAWHRKSWQEQPKMVVNIKNSTPKDQNIFI